MTDTTKWNSISIAAFLWLPPAPFSGNVSQKSNQLVLDCFIMPQLANVNFSAKNYNRIHTFFVCYLARPPVARVCNISRRCTVPSMLLSRYSSLFHLLSTPIVQIKCIACSIFVHTEAVLSLYFKSILISPGNSQTHMLTFVILEMGHLITEQGAGICLPQNNSRAFETGIDRYINDRS